MNVWWFALLFFLPAGIANMGPVLANKIPVLNQFKTPIDFGKNWRGSRIFGDNKTWRGLLFGALLGGLTALVTYAALPELYSSVTTKVQLTNISVFSVGVLLGAGALLGDALESFFKRRAGVKPGDSWFPFDQIDYVIGGLLFVSPLVRLTPSQGGTIFILYFGLHLLTAYLGYKIGLKDKPI